MTKREDLFAELRSLRPTDNDWATSTEGKSVMMRALNAPPPAQAPTRRRSRKFVVGVTAAVLVAGGATAAATIRAITADDPEQAGCYSTLAADANTTEADPRQVAELGAAEACRQTWTKIGEVIDTNNLVACVTPSGGRGIFPAPAGMDRATACNRIGLQPEAD